MHCIRRFCENPTEESYFEEIRSFMGKVTQQQQQQSATAAAANNCSSSSNIVADYV